MYYTELSGTVTSFNYGSTVSGALITDTETGTTYPGTRELANLNYGVCIAMAPGYCSIQWSQSSGDVYSFTVTNSTIGLSVDPGLPADSIIGENCTTDFVVIPNPYYSNGTAVLGDRFCGNEFPTVTSKFRSKFDIIGKIVCFYNLLGHSFDGLINDNAVYKHSNIINSTK